MRPRNRQCQAPDARPHHERSLRQELESRTAPPRETPTSNAGLPRRRRRIFPEGLVSGGLVSSLARWARDPLNDGWVLKRTMLAAHAGKAAGQRPAGQEFTKLPRDELGQGGAVGPVGRSPQEVIQVFPIDPVEPPASAWPGSQPGTAHAPA